MLIQTDKLKRRPRQIEVDEPASHFAVLQELVDNKAVSFAKPIKGLLTATWAGQFVRVSGRLTTSVSLPCGRCLAPVSRSLDAEIALCYSSVDTDDEEPAEEVEIGSEELGIITFCGPEIDLQPDIEQEIILSLPQQPLCSESCRGLCPVCGNNLNQKHCACEKPIFHSGLAALKNYKVEP